MKNNKIKLYAEALADIATTKLAGEGGLSDEQKAQNFFNFLKKNGDMGKAREILALAQDLFIKKTGRRKVVLETARKIKAKQKEELNSVLQKGDVVKEKINFELLAGIKIIINDKQLDLSMLKKLNNLFEK